MGRDKVYDVIPEEDLDNGFRYQWEDDDSDSDIPHVRKEHSFYRQELCYVLLICI